MLILGGSNFGRVFHIVYVGVANGVFFIVILKQDSWAGVESTHHYDDIYGNLLIL
jgi:hypothetical protein